ncbi:PREDICTED: citrate-binding protein-like [Prunus mume]|uniref:Citrate-binding protein-like n=1 Tax=Prunus mume TaxID=102107 RepID=A0ABM0NZM7_PRUMU|nr:PREDICTED: citrate-binding protein-like [Prunus mume]
MAYYSSFQLLGFFCLMISFLQLILLQALAWGPDVPTQGFVTLPFNRSFYHIQKPYDVPEDQRFSFVMCLEQVLLMPQLLMLRVYSGSLMYYTGPVLVPNIYDKWFKLNVIHDVEAAKVKVYIDGCLKLEADGRGGTSHAFKCGVYAQHNDSFYMGRNTSIQVSRKCRP